MLSNWIPYKLLVEDAAVQVLWLDIENRYMDEPFFDETIQHNNIHRKNKGRPTSQSDIVMLCEWASQVDAFAVDAFIFHVSRCGSTLLSQCLAANQQYVAISEAPLLDEILHLDASLLPIGYCREDVFKAALAFLGQKRLGQQGFFVKMDSWHLQHYALIRRWFSSTVFYFLSREPKAIIRSHEKRRGVHMIPGYLSQKANPLAVLPAHYADFSLYTAAVLSHFYKILRTIKNIDHEHNHFYDYGGGMLGLLQDFDHHVGTDLNGCPVVQVRLGQHSKYPNQVFLKEQEEVDNKHYDDCVESYESYLYALHKNRLKQLYLYTYIADTESV